MKNATKLIKTAYSYTRFSTSDQQFGDSERRQLADAKAYCERHGLRLSEQTFADRGCSAFHGKHRKQGNLKRLLETVQAGDVLLFENLDRWSREDPLDSQLEIRNAVKRGVEIVFMREALTVNAANFSEPATRYVLFFGAERANGESVRKRELTSANWAKKRADMRAGKPVRANRFPCWIEWDKEAQKPVVNEIKAATVRAMFELALRGQRIMDITRTMAKTHAPLTKSKRSGWNPATVRHVLMDKATIGELTLVSPSVPKYYPAIIAENVFYAVAQKLEVARRVRRHTGFDTNLFSGVAFCSKCGRTLVAHSSASSSTARLVCSGATKGQSDCGFSGVPLSLIEKSFLALAADGDLIRPLLASDGAKPCPIDALEASLADAEKQAAKLSKMILGDDDPPRMLYDRLKLEEKRARDLRVQLDEERARDRATKPALATYNEFRERLESLRKDSRTELRRAILAVLGKLSLDAKGKDGRWEYEVSLKGSSTPVTVLVNKNPEGWLFRSLRPAAADGVVRPIAA